MRVARLPHSPRLQVGEEIFRLNYLDLACVFLASPCRLLLGFHELFEDDPLEEIVDTHVKLHQGQHQLSEDLDRLLIQGLQVDSLTCWLGGLGFFGLLLFLDAEVLHDDH